MILNARVSLKCHLKCPYSRNRGKLDTQRRGQWEDRGRYGSDVATSQGLLGGEMWVALQHLMSSDL